MSNEWDSWKQSPYDTVKHTSTCSSCWSYTVFTHVQRNSIKQIKDEISWYPRPHICLVKLTGSWRSFSLPSPSCLDGIEGRELAPEMSLPTILRAWRIRVTYGEPKLWCSWTESYKHHILEAKAALSKAASLSCGTDRCFNVELQYGGPYQSATESVKKTWCTSGTPFANSVFECSMTEATLVTGGKWKTPEIRQTSNVTAQGRIKGHKGDKYWQWVKKKCWEQ